MVCESPAAGEGVSNFSLSICGEQMRPLTAFFIIYECPDAKERTLDQKPRGQGSCPSSGCYHLIVLFPGLWNKGLKSEVNHRKFHTHGSWIIFITNTVKRKQKAYIVVKYNAACLTEFRQRLKPSLTTDDCNGYLQAPWHCITNNHKLQKHKTSVYLSLMSEGQRGVSWHRLRPAEQLSSSWERRASWASSQARMPRGTGWDTRASKCRLEPETPRLPHIWTLSRGVRRHGILPVEGVGVCRATRQATCWRRGWRRGQDHYRDANTHKETWIKGSDFSPFPFFLSKATLWPSYWNPLTWFNLISICCGYLRTRLGVGSESRIWFNSLPAPWPQVHVHSLPRWCAHICGEQMPPLMTQNPGKDTR